MVPVMQDAIIKFEKLFKSKYLVKSLLIIDPTSPLRKDLDINKAINLYNKKNRLTRFST